MKRTFPLAIAAASAALLLLAAPASAQQLTYDDPAGDASGPGLDITRSTVQNRDHAVVTTVHFVRSVRGDLIVSIDPRHGRGVRVVSEYDPVGHTKNFVLPVAFTDRSTGGGHRVRCPGLRVHWSVERPLARLRLPSSCLAGGDYGAVRQAVLTERGSDTDYAPEGDDASAWVPRG